VSGQGEQEHGLNASRKASVPAIGRRILASPRCAASTVSYITELRMIKHNQYVALRLCEPVLFIEIIRASHTSQLALTIYRLRLYALKKKRKK